MKLSGMQLLRHYEQERTNGKHAPEIARGLGVSNKTLEGALTAARKERDQYLANLDLTNQEYFKVEIGKPWELGGDRMVVGDVHVPATNYAFACRVSEVAEAELKSPRKLVIAGDFWNFDAWSRFPAVIDPPAWKQERTAARSLIARWRETFDEIDIISGNHDWRRIIANEAAEGAEDLVDLLRSDGVRWSIFKWCWLTSGGRRWRVTHPRNYSIVNLSVVERLSQKYDCDVLGFHEHHLGISFDRYGRHLIVNGGCLVDSEKLAYVQLDDNASGAMVNGFVMIKGGYPYLYGNDRWTDWRKK